MGMPYQRTVIPEGPPSFTDFLSVLAVGAGSSPSGVYDPDLLANAPLVNSKTRALSPGLACSGFEMVLYCSAGVCPLPKTVLPPETASVSRRCPVISDFSQSFQYLLFRSRYVELLILL